MASEPLEKSKLTSESYVPRTMPVQLNAFDMTANYMLLLFNITISTLLVGSGAAGVSYLLVGGLVFFFPCAIVTAQLALMFPHEGALYNWSHKALGQYWSFFSGFCAWLSGALLIIGGPELLVTYLQNLHSGWLSEPWQQGLVISGLLILSCLIAQQRLRLVQNVINILTIIYFLAVPLMGFATLIWLLEGHPLATSFAHPSDWAMRPANFITFGYATFAYLSTEVPLILAGEMAPKREIITRHLLWGTPIVFASYLITTLAMLIVQGGQAAYNGFAPVLLLDMVFGKWAGNLILVCILAYFLIVPVFFNSTFARLLMVGAIDKHLPRQVGLLNRNRVPGNAIIFQTCVSLIFAAVVFLIIPYLIAPASPGEFATEAYNVLIAAATLVWALSVMFLFIDILVCIFRYPHLLNSRCLFPKPWTKPVLWLCCLPGLLSCLTAMIATVVYPWIPQISVGSWWYLVGGLALICLGAAAIGSMIANSGARWQDLTTAE
ncbi:MAG: APC family permease [Thermogemmatispora sp.]|uniref:APC family permease n=1 Tax=Thermogemmatispora sp. TaxID=1968838 RepID=UPI002606C75F|nr:APC family permease [Thermogemmatispora sp.]MBX5457639.1 APC family permease [Thermogemmatispora sp.]